MSLNPDLGQILVGMGAVWPQTSLLTSLGLLVCTLTFSGWTWGLLYGWGLWGCDFLLHGADIHGLGFFSSLHVSEGTCGHEP